MTASRSGLLLRTDRRVTLYQIKIYIRLDVVMGLSGSAAGQCVLVLFLLLASGVTVSQRGIRLTLEPVLRGCSCGTVQFFHLGNLQEEMENARYLRESLKSKLTHIGFKSIKL